MISVDLPAPLSPDHRQHLARVEVEVGAVQGRDPAEQLHQAAGSEDRFGGDGHAETLRIHWSIATGDDDQPADGEDLPQHVHIGEPQARLEHADG